MYIDILVSIPVTHQCAYVYEYLFTSITMSVCVYLLACTHVCVYWHTQAHTGTHTQNAFRHTTQPLVPNPHPSLLPYTGPFSELNLHLGVHSSDPAAPPAGHLVFLEEPERPPAL